MAALWLARGAIEDVDVARHIVRPARLVAAASHALAARGPSAACGISACARSPIACACRATGSRAASVSSICTISIERSRGASIRAASFVPHERWSTKRELYQESSDSAIFMAAVEDMLDRPDVRVCAGVRPRCGACEIEFEHMRRAPTFESFDWAEPTHERDRLLSLLRDRLERIVLPAPAIALRLTTGFLLPLQAKAGDLFDKAPVETLSHVLLERLRGRLGADAVHGIVAVAEHRPEFAWSRSEARIHGLSARRRSSVAVGAGSGRCGYCLFHCRSRLRKRIAITEAPSSSTRRGAHRKRVVGRAEMLAGITTPPQSSCDERLWIYRDRRSRDWYLHGLFG